jgi:pimeloyl-ACP methyl ester carboxylesterase
VPYADIAGMQLYYQEDGVPDGLPLVLLHAFMETGSSWSAQRPAFGARYRLVLPDLRGHGRTNNPGGQAAMTTRQFAHDIIGLCRQLGLERAAFCGHSVGAMLLLTLGLEAPALASALILVSGTYYTPDALRTALRDQTPETLVPVEQRPVAEALHTALGSGHWQTLAAAWLAFGTRAHAADYPTETELTGIRAPVLLVHGDRDHLYPVAIPVRLAALLPDAALCILPHTGHGVPRERPAWFNAIVLDFLTSRVARGR